MLTTWDKYRHSAGFRNHHRQGCEEPCGACQAGAGGPTGEDRMTPDLVFREHQLLDFLGVRGHLQREGPGGGHPPGAGEVPAGALALTSY